MPLQIIGMAQGGPLGLSAGAERRAAQGVFAADERYRRVMGVVADKLGECGVLSPAVDAALPLS